MLQRQKNKNENSRGAARTGFPAVSGTSEYHPKPRPPSVFCPEPAVCQKPSEFPETIISAEN